ncbi:protease Do-like 7 isoform X2 [Papaver somniferum]|uniref:protease Do-like 7 isoform X2 n=1 Tax=Papaver somniferum TaxID=3469 RepID=UPI000E7014B1|nr:protease Do-like 7 isoform X2 [Papaver somniferum]
MGSCLEENLASVSADDWKKAVEKVIPAVVVLRVTTCKAFDTYCEGESTATGFVVDKKRGIILTNRHVVKPGPVVVEAMFVNMEEIPVYPIYRDPVHDFGFFRYDPGAVKFLSYEEIPLAPEVASVGLEIRVVGNDSGEKVSIQAGTIARLDRDAPKYTSDGYNDFNTFYMQAASGTKSGSSGSPIIDLQGRAVAMNAGGMKNESATAYFLPLERVVRALSFIQKSKDSSGCGWKAVTIPRGTLQVTFLHKGFNETRKFGLKSETEQMVRHASPAGETGMLVVESLVPDGPAHKQLEPGDILVRVNGEVITRFLNLETILDDSVDQKIDLSIQRGDISVTVNLLVQDLHSITPNSFLEVSGAVIHTLSYQQARNFRFKCGVLYVAKPGYLLSREAVPRHAIIKKFAEKEISQMDDLIAVLSELSTGARVPLEYISHLDRRRSKSVLVTVGRHEWYGPPQIYTRNDSTGLWTARPALPHASIFLSSRHRYINDSPSETNLLTISEVGTLEPRAKDGNKDCTDERFVGGIHSLGEANVGTKKQYLEDDASIKEIVLSDPAIHEPAEERWTDIRELNNTGKLGDRGGIAGNASVAERVLEPALVICEVHVPKPCQVDGVYSQDFSGTGVIVYHSESMGLVVVDKSTVVVSCCDVMLSFAASHIKIPGEVVFLHPVHNYAFVAYDPSSLGVAGASAVRSATLLSEPGLLRGDSVFLVGLTKSLRAKSRKSIVVDPSAALEDDSYEGWPMYMATNMEVIELDTDFGKSFTGVLSDERGFVQAIWGGFSEMKFGVRGIPIYAVSEVLAKILSGERGTIRFINGIPRPIPLLRILDAELYGILPSEARSFGLSDSWIQALVKKDPIRRQVLRVKGCLAGSEAGKILETNDMVLAINKELITSFRDLEKACQGLDVSKESDGTLSMTIFRKGQEIEVIVGTDVRDGNGTMRIVNWCGCIVQEPHSAVRALGLLPEEGQCVYVSGRFYGSPACKYGLKATSWIVEVNGKLTPDLDSFVEVIKGLEHGEFVRTRTMTLNGSPEVHNLKQDLYYWPTWELKFDMETAMWRRVMIKALDTSVN